MKFTLAFLVFGFFAFSVCLAAPAENDTVFGGAVKMMEKGFEDAITDEDEDSLSEENASEELYGEDDDVVSGEGEADTEEEDDDQEEEKDGDDDADEDATERKRREISKLAARYVRDAAAAAQYHSNIFSNLNEAINAMMRR